MSNEEDPERGLSPEGKDQITKSAAFTRGITISVKQVFHSGKKRAMQTALIFSDSIVSHMGVAETDGLAPMDDPEIWRERVSRSDENLMLVGHLPHLARLSSLLLCGDADGGVLNFHAGSVACLHRGENDAWSVDWMIKPGLVE